MDSKQIIKEAVRELLVEKDNVKRSKGCIMYEFSGVKKGWDDVQSMISDEDVFDDETKGYGREDKPHVTILYGVNADVADEEVDKVLDKLEPVEVTFDKIDIFENPKFDVVKFSVTSEVLNKMNKLCRELPYENDFPDYKPHMTIAYVKKGEGKKYVKKLAKEEQIKIKSSKIWYSKADGSKKTLDFKKNE